MLGVRMIYRLYPVAVSASFEPIDDFGEPAQQCVLPLVAKIHDLIQPVGTGFVLNPNGLFATAAHVLEAAAKLAVRRQRDDGSWYNHYELYAIYISNEPIPDTEYTVGGLLPVERIWAPTGLDIGFGWLDLPRRVSDNSPPLLRPVCIRPALPAVGTKIVALGYYNMRGTIRDGDPAVIEYAQHTARSKGVIQEVYPEFRDRGMLSFPCFLTDARFDSGMSGSPIFDESGGVIGVVCSSTKHSESPFHMSYGSLVWPIFGCRIDVAPETHSSPVPTLLYDLALQGRIVVDNTINRVKIERYETGECKVSVFIPNK